MGLKSKDHPPAKSIDEGLKTGSPIKAFEPPSVEPLGADEHLKLEGHKAVSSYNWVVDDGNPTPTILVPGSPLLWKNPEFPLTPEKPAKADKSDAKPSYVDQDAHQHPSSPLAPLIAATKAEQPNFSFSDLTVVCDRVNLRRLMAWADHDPEQKDFRIDLELAGKSTVLMTRWESVNEKTAPSIEKGFKTEALAEAGCHEDKVIAGHQRIVTFEFMGQKLLVRFPVDACTSETRRRANTSASVSTAGTLSPESTNADLPPASIQDIASGLQIHQQGTLTPQSALIEFSLMSKTAKFDRVDAYDKMFFSQSPSMYLARHSKGSFGSYEDIKLREMRVEEKKAQPALQKLGALLGEIQSAMQALGKDKRAALVCRGGKLELVEREGGVEVPKGLKDYFEA